jgi:alkylation response protein AidB-like acyl-CoA dehydrogenase
MNIRVSEAANPAVLIERARSLVPAMRERSKKTNTDRKLPQDTIDDFRRLEFTRCLQPAMFGGFGADYRTFSKILRTLAQGCGSTAWVCGVHGEHNWVVGNFSEAAQRDVWGDNPLAVASASFPPTGSVETVAGGHRLNGKWSFASGSDYAQWFLLAGIVRDNGSKPEDRMFLVPASQVEMVDDWHVLGLAGTGSKSVVLKDVHVAATHSVSMHELKTGTAPGARVHPDNPMYRTPRSLVSSFSLSSVVVGLAERAVEEFTSITRDRRSRGFRVADFEYIQVTVAEAAAQVEAAVLLVENTIERNVALMASGQPVEAEHLAWTRRNSTYATKLAHAAVKQIFDVAGGTALYDSNPLQEIFRDSTAGASHLSLTWQRAAPHYGQLKLGQSVDYDAI